MTTNTVVNNANCALETPPEVKTSGAEAWHCTRVNLVKFRYLWKIENFSFFQRKRSSPEFAANDFSNTKWQLYISQEELHLCLQLKAVSTDQPCLQYRFKAHILNAEGSIGLSSDCFVDPLFAVCSRVINIDDLLDSSRGLLPNDTLTLVCDITVILDTIDIIPTNINGICPIEPNQQEDLSKLLETGRFSDVTFVVDNREFKAHKAILTVRSEVFAAMFDHETMDENKSNRVIITDFSHSVIREMLTFIYSNNSPNIDEMATDLLAAADKYALKNLKIMCEAVLHRDLTIDTAVETLILADRHCADQLKVRSLNVIKANISSIIKTNEWHNLTRSYPHLVTEIVSYIACK